MRKYFYKETDMLECLKWIEEELKQITEKDVAAADYLPPIKEGEEIIGEASEEEKKLRTLLEKLAKQMKEIVENNDSDNGSPLEENRQLKQLLKKSEVAQNLFWISVEDRIPNAYGVRKNWQIVSENEYPICPNCGERHQPPSNLTEELAHQLTVVMLS